MKFYENFERLCKEINKTPFRVTQELGLSNAIISYWRTGKRNPNNNTLQKIANYFNISVEELLQTEKKVYIIDNYKLTPEQHKKVIEYIEFLKSKEK